MGFPGGSAGKESAHNAGDLGSVSGLGKSPGEGKGYPLQYSGVEKSMDCIVHGVGKNQTRLSNFDSHFVLAGKPNSPQAETAWGSVTISVLSFITCNQGKGLPQSPLWASVFPSVKVGHPCILL